MSLLEGLDAWLEPLVISKRTVGALIRGLCSTYQDLALNSHEQFLATPVTKLPTGREEGEFLSIDLGGSNLRVAFVRLLGENPLGSERKSSLEAYDKRIEKHNERSWLIGETLKDEKAEDLFSWIGDCLAEVIRARFGNVSEMPKEIPLGITFSFPMMQSSLSEAKLLPMGKGFSITSNPNLGSLLLAGYEPHTRPSLTDTEGQPLSALPNIVVAAISNDSVATLISLVYTTQAKPNSKTAAGLILGTGCNAAVLMQPQALHPEKVDFATGNGAQSNSGTCAIEKIVVNTEWTLRGVGPLLDKLDLFTRWDKTLDAALPTPGFQPFEYMTAGSYLGEVVRLVLYDHFVEKVHLVPESLPSRLRTRNALTTSWLGWNIAKAFDARSIISNIQRDKDYDSSEADFWTPEYTAALMRVELLVLDRSKTLIAAAILALLACIGELSIKPIEDHEESRWWKAERRGGSWQHRKSVGRPDFSSSMAPSVTKELVVAYCGGLINLYSGYLEDLQEDLDFMIADFVKEQDTRIVLREAAEGGVIGAGVLAGTVWPAATSTEGGDKEPRTTSQRGASQLT